MFKHIALTCVTALTAINIGSFPLHAQTPATTERTIDATVLLDLNRAKNLARQAAERANGGLNNYRAEASMHGPGSLAPYVDNGNGTWTFTFKGRRPDSEDYTQESVVIVSTQGQVTVDYNGPVRSATP